MHRTILVTGGAGYIGSHTVVELLQSGYDVSIVDNFGNSSPEVLHRIKELTGKDVRLHEFDIRDQAKLAKLFADNSFDAVIHFAALKAVGESAEKPLLYYDNNVNGTLSLMKALQGSGVKKFIFSSSATVYGNQPIPYIETTTRIPENVYGRTKFVSELIMEDAANVSPGMTLIALRYFNPIGAHPSGKIGEDPRGTPNNLLPFVSQVAAGKREKLRVFGNDYPTPDGTCIRDYIHVVDLAKGHLAALQHGPNSGFRAYNLGTGHGESVLAVIAAFEKATSVHIPYEFAPRRSGDLPEYYANPARAEAELSWKAQLTLEDACRDTWNWQSKNPNGYTKKENT